VHLRKLGVVMARDTDEFAPRLSSVPAITLIDVTEGRPP
jgi:hypothetical protein